MASSHPKRLSYRRVDECCETGIEALHLAEEFMVILFLRFLETGNESCQVDTTMNCDFYRAFIKGEVIRALFERCRAILHCARCEFANPLFQVRYSLLQLFIRGHNA